MTDFPVRSAAPGVAGVFSRLLLLGKRLAAALRLWSRKRRGRRRLCELDDWMLRDIGRSRADAMHEVRKSFPWHVSFPWNDERRRPDDPWP